uniref:LRAT domain-containing protein n=1 Tax=Strongyloides papillosus TaxID=174720 RepID=A0A0N5C3A9_STREA
MKTLSQYEFKDDLKTFLSSFNDEKYEMKNIDDIFIRPLQTEWSSLEMIKILLKPGDIVEFERRILGVTVYSHFVIFLGIIQNDYIISHLAKEERIDNNKNLVNKKFSCHMKGNYSVQLSKIEDASFKHGKVRINNKQDKYLIPFNIKKIRKTSFNSLGLYPYNSLFDNCEHYVNRIRYGTHHSDQADKAYYKGFPLMSYITIFKYIQWKRKRNMFYSNKAINYKIME